MPDRIIRGLNGARGSVLLFAGLFCTVHAWSCTPAGTSTSLPVGLHLLSEAVPLSFYAVAWTVAAVLCFLAAFRRRSGAVRTKTDALAFGTVAGVTGLWSVVYLLGWVFDPDPSRQWVFALSYAATAGLLTAASRMVNSAGVRR